MGRRTNRITLRFLAAPADADDRGRSVAAGSVMEWIDKAGYACAVGWAGAYCVTACVGSVHHRMPIPPGNVVEVQARLVHTGRTSMHIVVTVSSADIRTGVYTPATTCILVFVAKGADGRPAPVPRWEPSSRSDVELANAAIARIPLRAQIKLLMTDPGFVAGTSAARVTMRFLVPPAVVNYGGKAHGGAVMRWIDEAAYACAASWTRDGDGSSAAIAVYSGGIHFFAPVHIGDVVEVDAQIIHTSEHSIHLSIRVSSCDPRRPEELTLTTQCTSVFVVPGDAGSALPVPQWQPTTDSDHRLWQLAREIVRQREQISPISPALTLDE